MFFPLSFWDISLWLAIMAIILLVTSEMLSQYLGKINIKKLRNVAFLLSILFLATVAIRIINILFPP